MKAVHHTNYYIIGSRRDVNLPEHIMWRANLIGVIKLSLRKQVNDKLISGVLLKLRPERNLWEQTFRSIKQAMHL